MTAKRYMEEIRAAAVKQDKAWKIPNASQAALPLIRLGKR